MQSLRVDNPPQGRTDQSGEATLFSGQIEVLASLNFSGDQETRIALGHSSQN